MTDNEITAGVPIEDDALESAAGGVTLPLSAEDILNIKPVTTMDMSNKKILTGDRDQNVLEVDIEHNKSALIR